MRRLTIPGQRNATPIRPTLAHRGHPQSGVTLTGLMVGLAVGSIVLSGTLAVYLMIVKGGRETIQQAKLNQELRAAMEIMEQDIRRAGSWDFADTNGDGDADGNGAQTWRDFGVAANGKGTIDTNADGNSDDNDLDPTNNPFQRQYSGKINNDLCVETDSGNGDCADDSCLLTNATGDCLSSVQTGRCITFSYDMDLDGRIGVRACERNATASDCPMPVGSPTGAPFDASNAAPFAWRAWYPPDNATKLKGIEMEMFGFRLRGGAIEMRTGRTNNADISFGCESGRWEAITSQNISITALEFRLMTQIRNANPSKTSTDTCETGDLCRRIRSVAISISGRLGGDQLTQQTVSSQVAVRNDRYTTTP
jgi:hypothetical protein